MITYYLLEEIDDKNMEKVNELYAPKHGYAIHFTLQDFAAAMDTTPAVAKRKLNRLVIAMKAREVS